MSIEPFKHALDLLEDLRNSDNENPTRTVGRIKEIVEHNGAKFADLDLAGNTSSDDMLINIDLWELTAHIRYARRNHKLLIAGEDFPDTLIGDIRNSMSKAQALKAKYPDRQEFQLIETGYCALDDMIGRTSEAVEAEIPLLKHAAHVNLARRAYAKIFDTREFRFSYNVDRIMSAIDTNLVLAYGDNSRPGCYANLEEKERLTARQVIEIILRRCESHHSSTWRMHLEKLLKQCDQSAEVQTSSSPRSGFRPASMVVASAIPSGYRSTGTTSNQLALIRKVRNNARLRLMRQKAEEAANAEKPEVTG